jgi:hypothetical protein
MVGDVRKGGILEGKKTRSIKFLACMSFIAGIARVVAAV